MNRWTPIRPSAGPAVQTLLLAAISLLFCSCGGGTAATASGGGGGGGGSGGKTTISEVQISSTKVPPATITFTLRGTSAKSVHVTYLPTAAPEGADASPVTIAELDADELKVKPTGAINKLTWHFDDDPALGAGFNGDLALQLTLGNGDSISLDSVSVGNDPPRIEDLFIPQGPIESLVGMGFTVHDDDELVDVRVEVNVDEAAGFPPMSWMPIKPALIEEANPIIQNQVASPDGTPITVFWDVSGQFGTLDGGVMLRFIANDKQGSGQPLARDVAVGAINVAAAPPGISIDETALLQSDDQRLGIVVPITVWDADADSVLVMLQWAREGDEFPVLPSDLDGLQALLADPEASAALQVASAYPTPIGGKLVPRDDLRVELPELASDRSHLLRSAHSPFGDVSQTLTGMQLDVLRASVIPQSVAEDWADNSLNEPVAAVPLGDGRSALVLDRTGSGLSRLREVDLSTGEVIRQLATGVGEPDALALEPGEGAALLAEHFTSGWRVVRVHLESLDQTVLADVDTPLGEEVRGLVGLGPGVGLVTAGDALRRVDAFLPGAPSAAPVLIDGLQLPWGLARNPRTPEFVYVAERGSGRVIRVSLTSLRFEPLPVGPEGLSSPRHLAFESRGTRLLVTTDEPDGSTSLRAVHPVAFAEPSAPLLASGLPESTASLATGADGLRLLALGVADDLAVGGGVAQCRTIASYQASRRLVSVTEAFAPPLEHGQRWRLTSPPDAGVTLEAGGFPRTELFTWDSRDLPGQQGDVHFRAVAWSDGMAEDVTTTAKTIVAGLPVFPSRIVGAFGETEAPSAVLLCDLDADGDLDLIGANEGSDNIAVFRQTGTGIIEQFAEFFAQGITVGVADAAAADLDADGDLDLVTANAGGDDLTILLGDGLGGLGVVQPNLGGPGVTDAPVAIDIADFDADGALDLVTANQGANSLGILFQATPFSFQLDPTVLGGPGSTLTPADVLAGDLDGDGDVDVVSANEGSHSLTVFWQEGAGPFDPEPLSLGGPGVTGGARGVAAADVDRDGDLDLVSANSASHSLSLFLQSGAGSFDRTPMGIGGPGTTDGPAAVTVTDFDGDGRMDVLSANEVGNSLTVFFQSAEGLFDSVPFTFGTPGATAGTVALATADLDNDGHQDLVSANHAHVTLSTFFQSGAGALAPEPLLLGGPPGMRIPVSVAVADVDGDGDQDIASANLGDNLTVFYQSPSGLFGSEPLILGDSVLTDNPVSIVIDDLDGNGTQDLLSANRFSHNLTAFFQDPSGVFDPSPLELGSLATTGSPMAVEVADIDGDGRRDIVSANQLTDTLAVFIQEGGGGFDRLPTFSLDGDPIDNGRQDVAVADVDGDGGVDLVSTDPGGGSLTIYFQSPLGEFAATSVKSGPTPSSPTSIDTADLDDDGDLDLVSVSDHSELLTLFLQGKPGEFEAEQLSLDDSVFSSDFNSVRAADVDDDGAVDLVLADGAEDELLILFQSTGGQFGENPLRLGSTELTKGPELVVIADVDGSGALDLISANRGGWNLTVFLQEESGQFPPVPQFIRTVSLRDPFSVAAADLNGDGRQDIVAASSVSDMLTVFLQDSAGGFHSPLGLGTTATNNEPGSVISSDLDGDGKPEVISANALSDTLTVFFQDELGGFDPAPLVITDKDLTLPATVDAADLDRDGDVDLVSTSYADSSLTVFYQESPRVFDSAPTVIHDPKSDNNAHAILAADVDGDGGVDLVSSSGADGVRVFLQSGAGDYKASTALPIGGVTLVDPFSAGVSVADVDTDGRADVLSSKHNERTLALFRQTQAGNFEGMDLEGASTSPAGFWKKELGVADLDSDGDLDIVSANGKNDLFDVFQQVLPGTFEYVSKGSLGSQFGGVFPIIVLDVDGDGDPDVVTVLGNTIAVSYNSRSP